MTHQTDIRRSPMQRIAVLIAVFVQIGATFLPQLGFGEPIGDRSDSVRTLITPSGWAFAIWGPLFLGSAVFAIWQALPGQSRNGLLNTIAWPAAVALSAQGVWATYTQFANLTAISAIIILVSLGGLLMCLRAFVSAQSMSNGERWFAALVLSALAAWLTAASIVNVSATLAFYGIGGGFAYPLAATTMIVIGGVIASVAVVRSRGNPWYALVFGWALLAIYFRGGQESSSIAIACAASGVSVMVAMAVTIAKPSNRRHWIGI